MPGATEAKTIDAQGRIAPKRKFDASDFNYLAEYIIEEHRVRKQRRNDRERQWKEIDRQIAMEPDISFKKVGDKIDTKKAWMAEMELPLQAQALEVLTADSRRMMFPDTGPWFAAHGQMTDDYLGKTDYSSIILGDENEVPSKLNQDNCDKLVQGFLLNLFKQYDFNTRMDRINAESFKYGMGVGRGRMESKNIYIHESRGTMKEKKLLPVLRPVSIKQLYLDEPLPSMHSATTLGLAHIAEDNLKFASLTLAANNGSTDPDDEDGGWMPRNVAKLEPNKDGFVKILEMEGDIVVPRRTTRSVILPGAIVTVAVGGAKGGSETTSAVIRFRWRKSPFSSYLLFPYHYEHVDDPYPTAPLMKGRPIQIAATDALNRLMNAAALKQAPPVGWDRNDPVLAAQGGPIIAPYQQWGSADPASITVHDKVGGDVGALSAVYQQHLNLYAELTGVLPSRLGAQTTSHTTAFAKDAELQRGAVRTVDYVRQSGGGPLTRWLDMAYRMGRDALGKNEEVTFFIDAYGGFVKIGKDHLPEEASFEWFGSGGPQEEQQKAARRLSSLELGLKMDQIGAAFGQPPRINKDNAVDQVLREGGWTDIDSLVHVQPPSAPTVLPGPAVAATNNLGPT